MADNQGLQDDYPITSFLDAESAINDIARYLKAMIGGGERADGKVITPIDGKLPDDSTSYILYDPSDDSAEMWLGGVKKPEWNKV